MAQKNIGLLVVWNGDRRFFLTVAEEKRLLMAVCSLEKMSDKEKSLVLAIIDFLDKSIQDGTVKQDDREGLEVASASNFSVRFLCCAKHRAPDIC